MLHLVWSIRTNAPFVSPPDLAICLFLRDRARRVLRGDSEERCGRGRGRGRPGSCCHWHGGELREWFRLPIVRESCRAAGRVLNLEWSAPENRRDKCRQRRARFLSLLPMTWPKKA